MVGNLVKSLAVLDRLAPLTEGDDRDAKANKAKMEGKRKELERSRLRRVFL